MGTVFFCSHSKQMLKTEKLTTVRGVLSKQCLPYQQESLVLQQERPRLRESSLDSSNEIVTRLFVRTLPEQNLIQKLLNA